jgi:hypothetical protein
MVDALETLQLEEFTWLLEDDVDADDLRDAAAELEEALGERAVCSEAEHEALTSVRWLVRLIRQADQYGFGLSGRFAERLDTKDRY